MEVSFLVLRTIIIMEIETPDRNQAARMSRPSFDKAGTGKLPALPGASTRDDLANSLD